jgi:hypothetical protein
LRQIPANLKRKANKTEKNGLLHSAASCDGLAGCVPGELLRERIVPAIAPYPVGVNVTTIVRQATACGAVYQDTVILHMPLTALANAPPGEQHIPLKLRYQACSTEICLPPVSLTLDAALNIASSASASKPAQAELFKAE